MAEARAQWKSKMGFILAASGSAIGLGNIVVFSGNAYKYGGGAFYVPYFVALFLIGIPIMILEFGLGGLTRKSFPLAMRQAGGRAGEWAGWFAILNAGFISMWYVTFLAWVVGMGVGSLDGSVFADKATVAWAGGAEMDGPKAYFFDLISGWQPLIFVIGVWILNVVITSRGTKTIELAVKVFVPLMWVAMLVLVVQGLSLDGGYDGVKVLFTPATEALEDPQIWQGAASQMLFTLSLGFGVMTAYASYLPKNSDMTHNAITTSLLNCGFEWIAGVAIFAILFVHAIQPAASTVTMMYFTVPKGIGTLPVDHRIFGVGFFTLLLIAGLTSSISLVEALVAAAKDKFDAPRWKVLLLAFVFMGSGSAVFALPFVVDRSLEVPATLGFALVDLTAHWSFDIGLMVVAIIECIIVGWFMGAHRIRNYVNENSRFHLGVWFDLLIRFVIPGILTYILVQSIGKHGLYGSTYAGTYSVEHGSLWFTVLEALPGIVLAVWIAGTAGAALVLSRARPAEGGAA